MCRSLLLWIQMLTLFGIQHSVFDILPPWFRAESLENSPSTKKRWDAPERIHKSEWQFGRLITQSRHHLQWQGGDLRCIQDTVGERLIWMAAQIMFIKSDWVLGPHVVYVCCEQFLQWQMLSLPLSGSEWQEFMLPRGAPLARSPVSLWGSQIAHSLLCLCY